MLHTKQTKNKHNKNLQSHIMKQQQHKKTLKIQQKLKKTKKTIKNNPTHSKQQQQ